MNRMLYLEYVCEIQFIKIILKDFFKFLLNHVVSLILLLVFFLVPY